MHQLSLSLCQYIAMYGDIGQKSNTMFFSDRPADVNALMAQAATIFKATPSLDQQNNSNTTGNTTSSASSVPSVSAPAPVPAAAHVGGEVEVNAR